MCSIRSIPSSDTLYHLLSVFVYSPFLMASDSFSWLKLLLKYYIILILWKRNLAEEHQVKRASTSPYINCLTIWINKKSLLIRNSLMNFWCTKCHCACVCHHEQPVANVILISKSSGNIEIYEGQMRLIIICRLCNHYITWI